MESLPPATCPTSRRGHVFVAGKLHVYCSSCGEVNPRWTRRLATNRRVVGHLTGWMYKYAVITARDGAACHYCGDEPLLPMRARLDHFIPRSKGGSDGMDNRRVACMPCDTRKGNLMPWEFMPGRFLMPEVNE